MGKKHKGPDLQEILDRPWCYYCERDFDDQKVLISHQKAKHFKCENCGRRLNTAGGLSVHLQQVHKETLTKVDNAMEGRDGVEPEIFAMEGIPEELLSAYKNRIVTEYFRLEAERSARTGNPPAGQMGQEPKRKKPERETIEQMKQRLAEHKAKKAAERQAKLKAEQEGTPIESEIKDEIKDEAKPEIRTENNTPDYTHSAQTQTNVPIKQEYPSNSYAAQTQANAPIKQEYPSNPYAAYNGAMAYPGSQYPAPHSISPGLVSQSPVGSAFPPPFAPPHYPQSHPYAGPQAAPYGPPFMPSHYPPMTTQMSGAMKPKLRSSPNSERPSVTPGQSSLPPAPGLPARPTFDMPNVNRGDMQRMHSGQAPPPGSAAMRSHSGNAPVQSNDDDDFDVDSLLKNAKNEFKTEQEIEAFNAKHPPPALQTPAAGTTTTPTTAPNAPDTPAATAPTSKRRRGKSAKLVYSDEIVSPEEKMASWSKFIIKRDNGPEFVLGDVGGAVTGVVVDEDTVRDVQD